MFRHRAWHGDERCRRLITTSKVMNFRQIFKTEQDLETGLSRRLRERLRRLLCLYKTRRRLEFSSDRVMRMVSVAWAFMGVVEMGNAAEVRAFPELLHRSEICIDGQPVVLMDDYADEGLMWDVACLMLEERSAMQCAYDIAGGYASSLAYDKEVMGEESAVVAEVPKVAEVCQHSQSVFSIEQKHAIFTEMMLKYLRANARKSYKRRSDIKSIVVDMLFAEGIVLPDDVRREISDYDDERETSITAITDMLNNITTLTLIDNKGEYINRQFLNRQQ